VNGLGASLLSCGKARRDGPFFDPQLREEEDSLGVRRSPQKNRVTIPAEVGRSSGSSPGRGWTGSREGLGQSAFAGERQLRDI
jgi:hypothetical protein